MKKIRFIWLITVYLQKYLDDNKNHYQFLINRKFVGTLRYASRHILNTERYSRRDDLESLMYV